MTARSVADTNLSTVLTLAITVDQKAASLIAACKLRQMFSGRNMRVSRSSLPVLDCTLGEVGHARVLDSLAIELILCPQQQLEKPGKVRARLAVLDVQQSSVQLTSNLATKINRQNY